MARIRSVKPELRTSLVVAEWPREVRYFWVLLWGYLDDYGRGVDDARLIKADCLPLDDDVTRHMVDEWVALIAKDGPLCRYAVNGKRYLHAPSWAEHQRPSHPAASRIPPCPIHEPSGAPPEGFAKPSGGAQEALVPEQVVRAGSREQGAGSAETPRPDVERVCAHLADKIAANGSKRPAITDKWRTEARRLIDLDKRPVDEILRVIDWCQADTFWRSNILAMPKLREKFDQLRLAAQRNPPGNRNQGNRTSAGKTAWTNYDDPDRYDKPLFRTEPA